MSLEIESIINKVDLTSDVRVCHMCPLAEKFGGCDNLGRVSFEIVGQNPKVLLVGEAPAAEDLKSERPFSSQSGSFLRMAMAEIGINDYALANVIMCQPKSVNIYTPTPEESAHCKAHIQRFVEKYKPETVILLGRGAYEVILPESYFAGQSVTNVTKKKAIEIDGVRYGAAFHPSYIFRNGGKESPQYIDFLNRLRRLTQNSVDAEFIVPFKIVNLDQLDETLEEFDVYKELGFDYEGTSLDPYDVNYQVLGLGMSSMDKAVYIDFHREPTQEEKNKISDFIRKKQMWVYNVNYETKVTWSKLSNDLIRFHDAMTLVKIDCSPGSLKDNARKYLNAEIWEEIVGNLTTLFYDIFQFMKKIEEKSPKLYNACRQANMEAIYLLKEDTAEKITGGKKNPKVTRYRTKQADHADYISAKISALREFCSDEDIQRGFTKFPYEWAAVPPKILGEYCCYDSYYTLGLKNHLWDKYKSVYQYYITQGWLGSTMESYGLNWDDDKASEHERFYLVEATTCLNQIIQKLDFGEKTLDIHTRASMIFNDPSLPDARKLIDLKGIFNPGTPDKLKQKPFWDKYVTDFTTAISIYLVLSEQILMSPIIPDQAIELVDRQDLNKAIENLMSVDWTKYDGVDLKTAKSIQKLMMDLIGTLDEKIGWKLYAFRSDVLEWQYKAHETYGGLDIDNRETWTPEFELLYLLRRYKKVEKSKNTYINGKVGRARVWLSTVDDYQKPPVRLKRYFDVMEERQWKKYELQHNERWILDTEFNVAGANTKRWKAAIHTVPWGSELREIYASRWWDGLFMHYDYSQAEVRILAAISQDRALLEAFADPDTDIHMFVASRIWKKDPKDVTPAERRYAKVCSFSILYGKSIEGFATEHTKGDVAAAKRIFDDFYAAFPQVKEWIEKQHRDAKVSGKVFTLFGDPLYLDMSDPNGAMRDAQNWPIQSSSSCVAGWAIWMNYEFSRNRNIPILPMVFTHDSHDMEFRCQHLFETIDTVLETAVDLPKRRFNLPMKIDWEIGVNQSDAIEFKETSRFDEGRGRTYHFECNENAMMPVFDRLKNYFDIEYEVTSRETERASLKEMFVARRAFSKYLGTDVTVVGGNLKLVKKNGIKI
ncbi:DNA polymerase A domain-containing protein [Rhizobium phage RHph_Y65]|uniref:DNA polymerase A domain-containing protein n=1 Tax=Rhizobium phage RHph_Y65 TaxID=2509785 RepID=A0A7S5RHC2_9CAUD|nr:DNA polymerase A domain-containing protein [Rhizobium phage RHph_Y65]QIG72859.1 DNA polymerase A domain-containing protein [Rhizobium phage RHph_Y65]